MTITGGKHPRAPQDKHYQMLAHSLATFYGVGATIEQVKALVTPGILNEIGPNPNGITDTYIRELVMQQLTTTLDLPAWPTYSDGKPAFHSFIEKFNIAAVAAGYTLHAGLR